MRIYYADVGDGPVRAEVDGSAVRLTAESAEEPSEARATLGPSPGAPRFAMSLDGRHVVGFAQRRDGAWHIELEGRAFAVRVDDERTHHVRQLTSAAAPRQAASELRAPMPGLVVRVGVDAGDEVRAGEGIVVMEAMKMENELRAERDGVVAAVHVGEGATVDRDALLVTFEMEAT